MEYWEITLDKAGQNIVAANLLYDQHLYGLSAYHAQQALELSIKAGAYKLGFLQYIHKTPPFRTHNPTKIILPFVYDFLIDIIQESTKSNIDEDIKRGLSEPLEIFRILRKTLYDAKDNEILNENLWKSSLKIEIHDDKILILRKTLDDYCNNRLSIFMEDTMNFVQNMICDIIHELRKTRHTEKLHRIIKDLEESIVKYDLPSILIKYLIDRNIDGWKNELSLFVQRKGEYEALDSIFGPSGALEMLQNSDLKLKINQKWSADDRSKITWMMYISTMSPLALQIYPHEEFGRYPKFRQDFDTEKIYTERKTELKNIIIQCELLHNRINKMLNPNWKKEKLG